jgi:CubicO group peptidase (beta-lactamase class C family)
MPDNFKPKNRANPHANYSVEQLYEFLSRHSLAREPGAKLEFSNVGMGLLGHALSLRAGMNYEELVKRRIWEPLGLKQTTITLTEAQQKRLAQGYNVIGKPTPPWDNPILVGAGGQRSSVNDLLRFLRVNIEPAGSPLEKALRASQVQRFERPNMARMAMTWVFADIGSEDTLVHMGGTLGFRNFAAFDPKLKIGLVVLANTARDDIYGLGGQIMALLSPPVAGIGVTMRTQGEGAVYPTILQVHPGGAAAKSGGIGVGDRLVGIEDGGGKLVDFKGKSQREVLALIRGRRGSTLRLVVEPKGTDERKVYELIREIIDLVAPPPSRNNP